MVETYSKELRFADLKIDRSEIYAYMGYGNATPDARVLTLVEATLAQIEEAASPVFGYRLYDGTVAGVRSIRVGQTEFATGSVIARHLKGSERFAIVIASAGAGVDRLIRRHHTNGDILSEYIADAVGSAVAEAVVAYAKASIEAKFDRVSNSYSPGYCGWRVEEQQKLFALLPSGFCGITLSESSLMSPIKSVSAIVGVGGDVLKQPYGCEVCEKIDCFKRKTNK